MGKKLSYGAALAVLAVLVTLLVWQGSFTFGPYGPADTGQVWLFWAVSTLIFLLTVVIAWVLVRNAVKLYFERQKDREGSRIKVKMFGGAVALSLLPVLFMLVFSIQVLNRNLDKWFSRPAENVKLELVEIGNALQAETERRAELQAKLLLRSIERGEQALRACAELGVYQGATLERAGVRQPLCEPAEPVTKPVTGTATGSAGTVRVTADMPVDLAAKEAAIQSYVRAYDALAAHRKAIRTSYLMLLTLIALFVLFASGWLALLLARQISTPISALMQAAKEVRGGNLAHRVEVKAMDEIASLVRAFNEMTTDLETNRHELERRRRFTEAILEAIPTGVLSVTSDGRVQRSNRALAGILDGDAIQRAGRLEDLFTREDMAELRYLMKRARRTGVAARQMEIASKGVTRQVAVTVAALENAVTSGFVIVIEDISDLLHAQKMVAWHEVARRIAHEIKNPLTPIMLCADRIARYAQRVQPPETAAVLSSCSNTILTEAESVRLLVNEFADFARFPAAQLEVADLNEVVRSAMAVFEGRLDGVKVHCSLQELPPVCLDREQFKRVVVNLIDNAAEAMQSTLLKQLSIETRMAGPETVEFSVSDTGCGISPEDKEKLFLPYFSTKKRGTGLGLAIISHIVTEHGGQIRAEENQPAGARFTVELPAASKDTRMAESVQAAAG